MPTTVGLTNLDATGAVLLQCADAGGNELDETAFETTVKSLLETRGI